MNKEIFNYLVNKIETEDNYYIFPSSIVLTTFLRKVLNESSLKVLPLENFLVWDKFKSNFIFKNIKEKTITPIYREIFIENLLQKNAEENFLKEIVVEKYSKNINLFKNSISTILSNLSFFDKKNSKYSTKVQRKIEDIQIIKDLYQKFLAENNLYDPSLVYKTKLDSSNIIIVGADLILDFDEYKDILGDCEKIDLATNNLKKLTEFNNYIEEIRWLFCDIREKLESANKYSVEDFMVTCADSDYVWLLKYFSKVYNLPLIFKSGASLSEYGSIKFLFNISSIVKSDFYYYDVIRFFTDKTLNWKEDFKQPIANLLELAGKYSVICGFDRWLNIFVSDKNVITFFKGFRTNIKKIVEAKSFDILKKEIQAFLNLYFDDRQKLDILKKPYQKALSVLNELINAENSLVDIKINNYFDFYIKTLENSQYVIQNKELGISVYNYKVACCATPKFHYIIGVNQNAVNISNIKFLFFNESESQELKISIDNLNYKNLSFEDAYLSSYCESGEEIFISYSNYMNGKEVLKPILYVNHSKLVERFSGQFVRPDKHFDDASIDFSKFGYCLSGIKNIDKIIITKDYDYSKFVINENQHNKFYEILKKDKDFPKLSASELDEIYNCPMKYFISKSLNLKPLQFFIHEVAHNQRGTITHNILDEYYKDTTSLSLEPDKEKLYKIIDKTFEQLQAGNYEKGWDKIIIVEPELSALKKRVTDYCKDYLYVAKNKFGKENQYYYIKDCEQEYCVNFNEVYLKGIIDCIISDGEEDIILDYKTGKFPNAKLILETKEKQIGKKVSFQLYFYNLIYKLSNLKNNVNRVLYYSFKEKAFNNGLDDDNKNNNESKAEVYKKNYENDLLAKDKRLKEEIEKAKQVINEVQFPHFYKFTFCEYCDYKKMCRKEYLVK